MDGFATVDFGRRVFALGFSEGPVRTIISSGLSVIKILLHLLFVLPLCSPPARKDPLRADATNSLQNQTTGTAPKDEKMARTSQFLFIVAMVCLCVGEL